MNYTKTEINSFKETVCPKCRCCNDCLNDENKDFTACPKLFNFKVYNTVDGTYPMQWTMKKEKAKKKKCKETK